MTRFRLTVSYHGSEVKHLLCVQDKSEFLVRKFFFDTQKHLRIHDIKAV